MTSKQVELMLYKYYKKSNIDMCFDVDLPDVKAKYTTITENMNLVIRNEEGRWIFFKVVKSTNELRKHNRKSFKADYNYYVMPKDVYDRNKDEIPENIGVITYMKTCQTAKHAKKLRLRDTMDKEKLKELFIKTLCRDVGKLMDLRLEKEKF